MARKKKRVARKKSVRKKILSKKAVRKKTARRTAAVTLSEETWFIHDDATTNPTKNTTLANHLNGPWNDLAITRVDRIEIGDTGWMATYRV